MEADGTCVSQFVLSVKQGALWKVPREGLGVCCGLASALEWHFHVLFWQRCIPVVNSLSKWGFVSFHPSTISGSSQGCPEHILLDSKVALHIKQTVSPHFYYSCGRL